MYIQTRAYRIIVNRRERTILLKVTLGCIYEARCIQYLKVQALRICSTPHQPTMSFRELCHLRRRPLQVPMYWCHFSTVVWVDDDDDDDRVHDKTQNGGQKNGKDRGKKCIDYIDSWQERVLWWQWWVNGRLRWQQQCCGANMRTIHCTWRCLHARRHLWIYTLYRSSKESICLRALTLLAQLLTMYIHLEHHQKIPNSNSGCAALAAGGGGAGGGERRLQTACIV